MIDNILIIDTETTGLSPDKGAKLIEIGAILYNVKHKTILQNFSTLLPCDENPVESINHISAESTRCKMPIRHIMPHLVELCDYAEVLIAHNAQFDIKFMDTFNDRLKFSERKWICTKNDFKWPVQLYRNRLQDICAAMGIPYLEAHRALGDCNLLAQCFNKVDDLEFRLITAMQNKFTNSEKYR